MPDLVIETAGLTKTYPNPAPITAVKDVSLTIERGERVAILGSSGAGKSTLLNLLGLLDQPSSGTYHLLGRNVATFRNRERDRARATDLGFVFQTYHILGHRTVSENVLLKLATAATKVDERATLIDDVLDGVGLGHRRHALGQTLSGGEKQRLAIARAIVTQPAVLLADEPTGNLDRANTDAVLRLFDHQAAHGVAVVVITHDDHTARWADRTLEIRDGRIIGT